MAYRCQHLEQDAEHDLERQFQRKLARRFDVFQAQVLFLPGSGILGY